MVSRLKVVSSGHETGNLGVAWATAVPQANAIVTNVLRITDESRSGGQSFVLGLMATTWDDAIACDGHTAASIVKEDTPSVDDTKRRVMGEYPHCVSTASLEQLPNAAEATDDPNRIGPRLQGLLDDWQGEGRNPLRELQILLSEMRRKTKSQARQKKDMAAFVACLGKPQNLATWLEVLLAAGRKQGATCANAAAPGSEEEQWATLLQYQRHSHYGHLQLLLLSDEERDQDGSFVEGSEWGLVLNVWQPTTRIRSCFKSEMRRDPALMVEPPHSHPYDFVSHVVTGKLRQTIYSPIPAQQVKAAVGGPGRYDGVALTHVDGVWPPHRKIREPCGLATERHVVIEAGGSYFLPKNVVHDVELDLRHRPDPDP